MKPWRLTRRAERSLVNVFAWTIEQFGERLAIAYRDALIERIELIAQGQPPHPQPCGLLMQGHASADDLVYYREGGHYIVMRDSEDALIVLEFFHQATDLPRHLQTLE
ncbi:MAG: type II toxin-antitoxin system RelE/ParE family toxin [Xanthomonadaceae bacterium]|nr:type II toxin-antitoxin system RelE/ParE family toxin [Xanthomonadaceae bacterium]